jgi:hypothetical protein
MNTKTLRAGNALPGALTTKSNKYNKENKGSIKNLISFLERSTRSKGGRSRRR